MSKNQTTDFVLCLSGGMDSTALCLRYLAAGCTVHGISFDYGQKHRIELDRLRANLAYFQKHGVEPIDWRLMDLSDLGQILSSALTDPNIPVPSGHYQHESMKRTFVPNRNAIFASIAYGFALSVADREDGPVRLALGVHAGDHDIYPDCRPEFYEALARAFQIGNWGSDRVSVELPYLRWNKVDILRDARASVDKLKLDFDQVFRNTCTSYAPDSQGRSSGWTGSDVERILAFHALGWVDPLEYQAPWSDVVRRALDWERDFRQTSAGRADTPQPYSVE
jgi:7-cyano-7-deazaguanine synthase